MDDKTHDKLKMQLEITRYELYQALERKKRAEKSLQRANDLVLKANQNHSKAIENCNLYTQTI